MSTEENKRIVRRLFEDPNREDLSALDEVIAPDFTFHNPADPTVGTGPAGFRQWIEGQRQRMRDVRITVEDQIAEGDKVATRFTTAGTDVASGKPVTISVIAIHELRDGKIVGHWDEADILGAMQQVGALPSEGQPR